MRISRGQIWGLAGRSDCANWRMRAVRGSEAYRAFYPDREYGHMGITGQGDTGVQTQSDCRAFNSLLQPAFLVSFPSLLFQRFWQHRTLVLPVYTPCFSFSVPLWLLVLSLRCFSPPSPPVVHVLSKFQWPAHISLPPWGFPGPLK